jgi:tetratricopeptide (TPR) repeat protein
MMRAFQTTAVLGCAALTLGYSSLWAQKPKTKKEAQAIMAVQQATTPDARIQAIENVLDKFADTEYKPMLLQMAIQTEQQKGDYAQTVFYCQRLLKVDPKNAYALVTLAGETARHTRANDLDKDEQLAKIQKWANDGIEAAKTMPKLRPDISDADWTNVQKDFQAQGYIALGMADVLKKDYTAATDDYKKSLAVEATPNPATLVRLAQAYMDDGKYENADFTLDKAIAMPNAPAQVKSIAQAMKGDVARRKAAAANKPAAGGSGKVQEVPINPTK